MKIPRRRCLYLAAGAVALPAVSRIAKAQAYPTRPVRIIVGFAAGNTPDILARLMGQWLSERLGQPFIIENRPGAGGNIGTEVVVRAPADGYTLLLGASANVSSAMLYDKLNFNFVRDVAPVAILYHGSLVMEVNPSVPAKTVPEFIAYAKANPGKVAYATAGNGTTQHVAGELFKMMTSVNMIHVPYRGAGPALIDLLAGQVQVMFDALPSSIGYIKPGKLRPLAVTTATRSQFLPDIPTVGEFVPGYEVTGWNGIGAPKNTPAEIIDKLNREINAGLASRFQDHGAFCRFGRSVAADDACRLRQVHRRRSREMGQGGQVRGHQGGLIGAPCKYSITFRFRESTTPCCAASSFLAASPRRVSQRHQSMSASAAAFAESGHRGAACGRDRVGGGAGPGRQVQEPARLWLLVAHLELLNAARLTEAVLSAPGC
jgi:tripartite-type tricarboxylate transporter receptor subunit TctC